MAEFDSNRDRAPLGHLGGVPVYATTALVAAHVATMILFAILQAANAWPAALIFSRGEVLRGQAWRVLSYALLNAPTLWFVVEMYLLFVFGREIENFFGRRAFLRMYALLIVAAPLALLAVPGATMAGAGEAHLAVFIAFATIYPGTMIWFRFPAKWVAIVIVGLNALQALAYHAWSSLVALLVCSFIAFAFVRLEQGRWSFKVPRATQQRDPQAPRREEPLNVDAILEKISRHGMSSLDAGERAQLAKAREKLLRK